MKTWQDIENRLRSGPPADRRLSPELHGRILQAVRQDRAADDASVSASRGFQLRWLLAPALAALIAFIVMRPAQAPVVTAPMHSLAAGPSAGELLDGWALPSPAALEKMATGRVHAERQRLGSDLYSAAEFVVGMLPKMGSDS